MIVKTAQLLENTFLIIIDVFLYQVNFNNYIKLSLFLFINKPQLGVFIISKTKSIITIVRYNFLSFVTSSDDGQLLRRKYLCIRATCILWYLLYLSKIQILWMCITLYLQSQSRLLMIREDCKNTAGGQHKLFIILILSYISLTLSGFFILALCTNIENKEPGLSRKRGTLKLIRLSVCPSVCLSQKL